MIVKNSDQNVQTAGKCEYADIPVGFLFFYFSGSRLECKRESWMKYQRDYKQKTKDQINV